MLCRRDTKPPVKQAVEEADEHGEHGNGLPRARRFSAESGEPGAPESLAALRGLHETLGDTGPFRSAAEARHNSAELIMSGGLGDQPVTAAFVAPTARMTSQMPGSV